MLGSTDDFSAAEAALIPDMDEQESQDHDQDDEGQQTEAAGAQSATQPEAQQAEDIQDEDGQEAAKPQAAPAPQAQPAVQDDDEQVSRRSLRAARHAERQATKRVDALQAELEALRAKHGTGDDDESFDGSDERFNQAVQEVAQDIPVVSAMAKRMAAMQEQLRQLAPQVQAKPEDFTPPQLPPEIQDDVDMVPALLSWQVDPSQTNWQAAVAMDAYLRTSPAWAGKTQTERFREVVRRVNEEAAPRGLPRKEGADIDAALSKAQRRTPSTLSDIGGGDGNTQTPSLSDQIKGAKSEQDIFALLDRAG